MSGWRLGLTIGLAVAGGLAVIAAAAASAVFFKRRRANQLDRGEKVGDHYERDEDLATGSFFKGKRSKVPAFLRLFTCFTCMQKPVPPGDSGKALPPLDSQRDPTASVIPAAHPTTAAASDCSSAPPMHTAVPVADVVETATSTSGRPITGETSCYDTSCEETATGGGMGTTAGAGGTRTSPSYDPLARPSGSDSITRVIEEFNSHMTREAVEWSSSAAVAAATAARGGRASLSPEVALLPASPTGTSGRAAEMALGESFDPVLGLNIPHIACRRGTCCMP